MDAKDDGDGSLWFEVARGELRRLQDEFRGLQNQSHGILGVGSAFASVGAVVGGQSSHSIAGLFATVAFTVVITWYLNINAESVAVGCARARLANRINDRFYDEGLAPPIQSEFIQAAGRKGSSTNVLAALIGLVAMGVAAASTWFAWQSPMELGDQFFLPSPYRQATQVTADIFLAVSAGLAMRAQATYAGRYEQAYQEFGT